MSLTTNLVSYYKTDESSGNASDIVGSKTLTNTGVTYVSGKINNGAQIGTSSGNSNSLYRADGLGIDMSGACSVAFWAKLTADVSGTPRFLDWRSSTGTSRYLIINYRYTGVVYEFNIDPGGGGEFNYTYARTTFSSNWTHIALTYSSGGTATFYLNGSAVATGTRGTSPNGDALTIGNSYGYSIGVPAIIDEIGFWSKELTSTEVSQLYNGGAGLAYPLVTSTPGFFSLM